MLFLREWYMHPNGQLPAYEFAFGDVNPPVHAWAAWRVYKMTGRARRARPRSSSRACFQKLLLNFTWWVNRKDAEGNNLFARRLPRARQHRRLRPLAGRCRAAARSSRPTAPRGWRSTARRCSSMALELARDDPAYEDMASKFFEHFVAIADAMNTLGGTGLWDERGRLLLRPAARRRPPACRCAIRSLVGLMPLFAVEVLEQDDARAPARVRASACTGSSRTGATSRARSRTCTPASDGRAPARDPVARAARARAAVRARRERVPLAVRHPLAVARPPRPAVPLLARRPESRRRLRARASRRTGIFGGNSNWRGPVWFPVNYLLIEALERYHHFYGDDAARSSARPAPGGAMNLLEVARRAAPPPARRLFLPDADGPPAVSRRRAALRRRSALARPRALPRVLPRRHGPRLRREPPDRLDRADRAEHRGAGARTERAAVSRQRSRPRRSEKHRGGELQSSERLRRLRHAFVERDQDARARQ